MNLRWRLRSIFEQLHQNPSFPRILRAINIIRNNISEGHLLDREDEADQEHLFDRFYQ